MPASGRGIRSAAAIAAFVGILGGPVGAYIVFATVGVGDDGLHVTDPALVRLGFALIVVGVLTVLLTALWGLAALLGWRKVDDDTFPWRQDPH